MLKKDARRIFLTRQKSLLSEERQGKSRRICENFFRYFRLYEFEVVHLFLTIEKNNEVITSFIYEKLWNDLPQIKTLVPRVNPEKNEIEILEFGRETRLSRNSWQIPEPTGGPLIDPEIVDLVLVPLLVFDKRGFRVGYGRGFYDRFLQKCRRDCVKIGLSNFPPIDLISDTNQFDVALNYCVTPENIWKF